MTDKDLIRRALMGDQEAQKECTEKGIVLPCPCCGIPMEKVSNGFVHPNTKCILNLKYFKFTDTELISLWNTRPAPPIGRCKDCIYSLKSEYGFYCDYEVDTVPAEPEGFCGNFEPKEE